ncbi:MAG: hypothetical protein CL554_10055 [Algoriphagus sp.]|jgi:hypothetical protein|uniref:sensor histidine kinase n=1 Tax=unclassified Algoriphagus TaxID=2641541 RepID=UPI000C5C4365|nr:hypothetical protein [Algoriphagus sp.]MAN87686.1 hypothetical protein [Algoriphagus sp.]|tara:strand:- start:117 stop:833 length:717 start_codon:yes stop_codon:yes gene_type:complete
MAHPKKSLFHAPRISLAILPLFLMLISFSTSAQINSSKGVPSYTNYVFGGNSLAGQQVWNVNQNKEGFLFVGTSSGLQKFDGKNWNLLASPSTEFNTNIRSTLSASDGTFYYGALGDFGTVVSDSTGKIKERSLLKGYPADFIFNDIWSIRESKGKIYFQAREAIFVYTPPNGNGIPDSIKEKIFQPFFTTKPTGSVTGLGLSPSYDIIKAHGGELRVISEEGKGTEMKITLPIHKDS